MCSCLHDSIYLNLAILVLSCAVTFDQILKSAHFQYFNINVCNLALWLFPNTTRCTNQHDKPTENCPPTAVPLSSTLSAHCFDLTVVLVLLYCFGPLLPLLTLFSEETGSCFHSKSQKTHCTLPAKCQSARYFHQEFVETKNRSKRKSDLHSSGGMRHDLT